jgi:hypothetical protein
MPLCQGFALASKHCRLTAFLTPTQQLEKEFRRGKQPRCGVIPRVPVRRRWRNPDTLGAPYSQFFERTQSYI